MKSPEKEKTWKTTKETWLSKNMELFHLKIPEKSSKDLKRSEEIWKDLSRSEKDLKTIWTRRSEKIWKDLKRSEKIRKDLNTGKIWIRSEQDLYEIWKNLNKIWKRSEKGPEQKRSDSEDRRRQQRSRRSSDSHRALKRADPQTRRTASQTSFLVILATRAILNGPLLVCPNIFFFSTQGLNYEELNVICWLGLVGKKWCNSQPSKSEAASKEG